MKRIFMSDDAFTHARARDQRTLERKLDKTHHFPSDLCVYLPFCKIVKTRICYKKDAKNCQPYRFYQKYYPYLI